MTITESDFTLKPCNSSVDRYDLTFNKRVKKRDTGLTVIEPGDTLYGLSLPHALRKIVHHRVANKWKDENVTLIQFIKEIKSNYSEVLKLLNE